MATALWWGALAHSSQQQISIASHSMIGQITSIAGHSEARAICDGTCCLPAVYTQEVVAAILNAQDDDGFKSHHLACHVTTTTLSSPP
jgi:hypothetical protein